MTEGPCVNCPDREGCTEICELLDAELPSDRSGEKEWMESFTDAEDDPFGDMLVGERKKIIDINRRVLDDVSLTRTQREVAEMYYWEGLTQREIAAKRGRQARSVRYMIARISARISK